MSRPPRLVYVATASPSTVFFDGQLRFLREQGFEVSVVSAEGKELRAVAARNSVAAVSVPLAREIKPLHDLVALGRLTRLFRQLRPDLVAAATPKGSLLGLVAARLAGVPVRVYLQYGLRLETATGFKRRILSAAESADRRIGSPSAVRQRKSPAADDRIGAGFGSESRCAGSGLRERSRRRAVLSRIES